MLSFSTGSQITFIRNAKRFDFYNHWDLNGQSSNRSKMNQGQDIQSRKDFYKIITPLYDE